MGGNSLLGKVNAIFSCIFRQTPHLETMAESSNFTGRVLIAAPDMGDHRFTRSVIYICSHDEHGAMGIIINKGKSGLRISDMLEQIGIEGQVRVADSPVLSGGPVDIDRGFVLHSADYFKAETSLKLTDTLSLTSTKDILEALVNETAPEKAMLAVGYAGWGAGQLEAEITQNAWLVTDIDEALIYEADLDGKWEKALLTMGITPDMLAHSGGRA